MLKNLQLRFETGYCKVQIVIELWELRLSEERWREVSKGIFYIWSLILDSQLLPSL